MNSRMYANILMSTDGSDVARKGVQQGIALAKALNAKATVITVTETLPGRQGAKSTEGQKGGVSLNDFRFPQRRTFAMHWCTSVLLLKSAHHCTFAKRP